MQSWSRGQTVAAQSSGEAGFYAIVCGTGEGLSLQSILHDLGLGATTVIFTDSNAGRAITNRLGAGRMKHIETKYLHVQNLLREGRLSIQRVDGITNPVDLGTKAVATPVLVKLLPLTGLTDMSSEAAHVSHSVYQPASMGTALAAMVLMLQTAAAKAQAADQPEEHGILKLLVLVFLL